MTKVSNISMIQTFKKSCLALNLDLFSDLPQNFDTCITILTDYTAPKHMLDRGPKKARGRDI